MATSNIKLCVLVLMLAVICSVDSYAIGHNNFKIDISKKLTVKSIYKSDVELVSNCMLRMQSFRNNKIFTNNIQESASGVMSRQNGSYQLRNASYGKDISWHESIKNNNNKLEIEYLININKDIKNSIIYISCHVPNGEDFTIADAKYSNKQIYYKTKLGVITFVYSENDSYLTRNRHVLKKQMRLVIGKQSKQNKYIKSGKYNVKLTILLPDVNILSNNNSKAVKIGFAKQPYNNSWLFKPNTKVTMTTPLVFDNKNLDKISLLWEITDYYDDLVSRVTESMGELNDKVSFTFVTPDLYGPYRLTLKLTYIDLNKKKYSVSKDVAVFGVINPIWGSIENNAEEDRFVGAIIHGGNADRFKMAHDLGIRWKRCEFEVSWSYNSQAPFVYNFKKDSIKKVNDAGLLCLGQMAYSPAYSVNAPVIDKNKYKNSKSLHHPLSREMPDSFMFEDYVRNVVEIYGENLRYLELWNEPDIPKFFNGSPEQYISLLRILNKVKSELLPEAKIVAPSTANMGAEGEWTSNLLNLDAINNIDIWSYHRYINDPYFEVQQYHDDIHSLRLALNSRGGTDIELWNTEGGINSQTMFRDAEFREWPRKETRRERDPFVGFILPKMFTIEMAEDVKKHFIYFLKNSEDYSSLHLLEFNNSPKYTLFPVAAWKGFIDGSEFVERQIVDDVVYVYRFKKNIKHLAMIWANIKPENTIDLPNNKSLKINYFDSLGNNMSRVETIPISVMPIYAEFSSDKYDLLINNIQRCVTNITKVSRFSLSDQP